MKKRPNFKQANVLVLGDVMLDSYWYGAALRISPEAPVPVVNVGKKDLRPGGAANVALNVAELGVTTRLLGMIGEDEYGDQLLEQIAKTQVHALLGRQTAVPTINKLRIISQNQQLLRLDFEQSLADIDKSFQEQHYQQLLNDVDVVVLSDYGKGTLAAIGQYIQQAKQLGKIVLVDPKGQDFDKYQGATLLTPNLKEFELVVGACKTESEIFERGQQLLERCELEALLITRGADGMTLLRHAEPPFHLSAMARDVYDVTGAGDTVIGVLAAGLASGLDITQALELSSRAASIVVGHLGASRVSEAMLLQEQNESLLSEA